MSQQSLHIYYEGNRYKNGKIDVKEFAPSLLAFGELIDESNRIINDKKAEIRTYITADFEKKCFKCNLSLESSTLLQSTKNLFGLRETLTIKELLELIGFIGSGVAGAVITSYVAYKLIEKGRKVTKHTVLQDGTVALSIDETTVKVDFNLFKFIQASWQKKSTIHKNFEKHLQSSDDIGYSSTPGAAITRLTKNHKDAITAPDYNRTDGAVSKDIIETALTIRIADFYGDTKWTFMYDDRTLHPNTVAYSDAIKNSSKRFEKK